MIDLVELAKLVATVAHHAVGQRRKYTDEPYIVHPREVVEMLKGIKASNEVLAAAWLHDVVEDTKVPLTLIYRYFGPDITDLVDQLTDISTPDDGNRAIRKAIDRNHIAEASPDAKTIKLADLISNTKSIVFLDKEFAKVYMAEKRELLTVLREGDKTLFARAESIVNYYYKDSENE